MGRQYIEGFKGQDISFDELLKIHLTGNHYPPVSLAFVPACKEAIEACEGEDCNKIIELPNGRKLAAYKIIEGLHLDTFLSMEEF